MSLIDEALKRARMEAAQRAAEGEGLPYPTIPRHLGPPRRASWLVPLAVMLAVVVGVAVGVMLASRGPAAGERPAEHRLEVENPPPAGGLEIGASGDPPPIAAPSSSAIPAPQPDSSAAPPAAQPQPRAAEPPPAANAGATAPPAGRASRSPQPPDPADEAPGKAPRETQGFKPVPSTPRALPAAPPPPAADRQPSQSSPGTAAQPAPAAETREAPRPTTVTDADSGVLLVLPERFGQQPAEVGPAPDGGPAAETFTRQLPLSGGGAIELGGIAWSETGPFALINGRVVGPGASIEGYTLERIRPGHVILTGDGRRIQLSLQ